MVDEVLTHLWNLPLGASDTDLGNAASSVRGAQGAEQCLLSKIGPFISDLILLFLRVILFHEALLSYY